jgi:hypothetical protein
VYCWPCRKLTFDCTQHAQCRTPGTDGTADKWFGAAAHQNEVDYMLRTLKARLDSGRMPMRPCCKDCVVADVDAKYLRMQLLAQL